jgi:predicted Rossmann fold nucleotide-binding protein DprA/Smf involved in DNA uptake
MADAMIWGFTGTREQLTDEQRKWLWDFFCHKDRSLTTLHHGACRGADAFAHHYALGEVSRIIIHPPADPKDVDLSVFVTDFKWTTKVVVLKPKPYLARNRDIVDACDRLLALPKGPQTQRSGTWSTIRYAQAVGKGITVVPPDGRMVGL